jgi:Sulfatase
MDEPLTSTGTPGKSGPTASRHRRLWSLTLAAFGLTPLVLVYAGAARPDYGLLALAWFLGCAFWILRARVHGILLVFLGVMLVGTVVSGPAPKLRGDDLAHEAPDAVAVKWSRQGPFDERLPIVVHIIFDEMMSPGALDSSIPGAAAARQRFEEFGARYGFRTFDSVYSRYFFSGVSIPNLMNAGYLGHTHLEDQYQDIQGRTVANAYFDAMAARGYRTVVFQTAVLDFCHNASVRMCETFNSFDPAGGTTSHLDARTRTLTMWSTMLRAMEPSYVSQYGQQLVRMAYGLADRPLGVLGTADRFDAQQFPDWFDRFVAFVKRAPRGTHIFAHFMAPHSPYLLTPGCVVSGKFDAGYYLHDRYQTEAERLEARGRYYATYLMQVACVQRKLSELMDAISSEDTFRDATIIVHGDHGSRISAGNLIEDYQPRDFIDNYAAYFAVREPGVEPGVDCRFLALSQVLRRYLGATDALPPPDAPRPPVVVHSRAGKDLRIEAAMPAFGCAAR